MARGGIGPNYKTQMHYLSCIDNKYNVAGLTAIFKIGQTTESKVVIVFK